MNGSINTVKYVIQYPYDIKDRFEKEVIAEIDKLMHEKMSQWLSMRYKKEYEEKFGVDF